MFEDFIKSFKKSDCIFILPVYTAGEKKIGKIDSSYFYKATKKKYKKKLVYLYSNENDFLLKLKVFLSQETILFF